MATIESTISLNDKFSPQVNKMSQALDKMTSACKGVETATQQMSSGINSAADSSIKKFGLLSAAAFGVYQAYKKAAEFIAGAMNLSDEYAQTNARLNLMNDGLQTTAQLQNLIFDSAQRTGQKYAETADFVAKLGLLSGNAFPSNKETVAFAEQISKHLNIAGTDAAAAQGSMLQLQQALSMGVLRGQELNSVMQGMPTVIQAIEKELGVSRRELREMANDGQISADIIKRAILNSVDETNKKFEAIPVTFTAAFNKIGNVFNKAFEPVWEVLGSIANNKNLQTFVDNLYPIAAVVAAVIASSIGAIKSFASTSVPILQYVFGTFTTLAVNGFNVANALFSTFFPFAVGLLASYAAYWAIVNGQMVLNTGISAAIAAWQSVLAATTWAIATAKAAWTAITYGAIAAQLLLGLVLAALSSPIVLISALVIGAIGIFAGWAAAGGNLRDVLASAFEGIVDATEWMVNSSTKLINFLIAAYNKAGSVLGKVLGYDFTEVGTIEYKADFSSFKDKWSNAIRGGTIIDTLKGDLGIKPFELTDNRFNLDTTSQQALQDTAKNTKGIKDAMEITEEDLKYYRDLAEREIIQQFQVSEIRVDMSGMNNNISTEADIEDVAAVLKESIEDQLVMSTEGEHE